MNPPQSNEQKFGSSFQAGIGELENSKIIRSIWKNTFDKILEIKISNKRTLKDMKEKIMVEERKKLNKNIKKNTMIPLHKKKLKFLPLKMRQI